MNTIKELKSVIVKKDLISKLKYKNEKQVPRVKSIILHIGCRNQDLKSTAKAVFALKTITGDKGRLTRSKKTNLRFNTKKNTPSGAIVEIKGKKMSGFYDTLITEVLPKCSQESTAVILKSGRALHLTIRSSDILAFESLGFNSYLVKGLPTMTISFMFDRHLDKKEQALLLPNLCVKAYITQSGRVQPCQG